MESKILVVDDEESIRYTFESFLSDDGYDVSTAKDYDEAMAAIQKTSFSLIFTDIILGGKTGIDLLQEVRKRNMRCPVIIITGFPNVETASDAVRLGAFDYIFKPVRQNTLIHTARMALENKALHDENENYRLNLEAIFRSVNEAIITVNENMEVLEVNNAAQEICGMNSKFVGKSIAKYMSKCSGKCLDALSRTIKGKKAIEVHRAECEHNGLLTHVVSINTSPLINSHGEFSGAVMVIRDETRLNQLERNLKERQQFHKMIGQSQGMQRIYSLIEDLADIQTTVLILGESGTGKELVAEAIHSKGNRSNYPIVKVNCSALTEGLLESELFGHIKGAFTGADRDKTGRFQRADRGTIFLDEIGDISPKMQLRLLRVLQEREFERVGDSTPIKVDVRVIAATNQDLNEKVRRGEFREDLFYRLNVMELALPPLRERKDDISLLLKYFLEKFNGKFNKNILGVSDDVRDIFMNYQWPGNIRELEHTLEHSYVTAKQSIITTDQLPKHIVGSDKSGGPIKNMDELLGSGAIIDALRKSGWNKSKAARYLGVNVRTIYRKIEKYQLEEELKKWE